MEENNMQSPKKVICCKLKDTEKLMASQSGGAFTAKSMTTLAITRSRFA